MRRTPITIALLALALACGPQAPPGREPAREPTRENLLDAARSIMEAARFCSLITVDAEGQPRARTVAPLPPLDPRAPGDDMVVWIATRPVTRKVEQLRANPRTTLYYFDAERLEYVTIMGTARLVDDPAEKERRRDTVSAKLYPNWPDDYLLIEVTPTTLEVLGRGIEPDPVTWKPPTLEFEAAQDGR